MDLQLRNSKVVLCGATGLIGKTIALELAREGAHIALLGRHANALAALQAEVEASGSPGAIAVECQLDSETSTDRAIRAAIEAQGGIDVFIFAAGAAQGGIFWEMDDLAWRNNLEIKLFGAIRALRTVAPAMIERRAGRIVVVVGNSAKFPEPRMLPGAAANAALLAIVRGLAEELGPHGVSINAVNPGPVRSPRWDRLMQAAASREGIAVTEAETRFLEKTALRRLGSAEEVATHVVYLASPRAAHLTGTSITIDGGSTKSP
ncbi:MAG: SDR family oxidoreductase [Gammaproteobacteria bacterium]|nr:SDR family oxidoreductase [Gammaproteobacteria bacterium]